MFPPCVFRNSDGTMPLNGLHLTLIWLAANQTTENIMICHAAMDNRSCCIIHWLLNSYAFNLRDQTCILGPLRSAILKLCLVIDICAVYTKHHIVTGPICRYFLQRAHSGVRRPFCVILFAYSLLTNQSKHNQERKKPKRSIDFHKRGP